MVQITTGRLGSDSSGNLYALSFHTTPTVAFSMVQVGTTATPISADIPAGFVPVDYGPSLTLTQGERLPDGTWQIESGAVYAGGDVTIREVIIG